MASPLAAADVRATGAWRPDARWCWQSAPFAPRRWTWSPAPLRDVAHDAAPAGTEVLVGGQTMAFADVRDATDRDLRVIFPVAGLLFVLILAAAAAGGRRADLPGRHGGRSASRRRWARPRWLFQEALGGEPG